MTEGYWRRTKDERSQLPFPEPSNEKWDIDNFTKKLSNIETIAQRRAYRGFSVCRLCGCANGNSEYSMDHWTWPQGLLHYVEAHKVKPSNAFIAFVANKWSPENTAKNTSHENRIE